MPDPMRANEKSMGRKPEFSQIFSAICAIAQIANRANNSISNDNNELGHLESTGGSIDMPYRLHLKR